MTPPNGYEARPFVDEMRESYLSYAMSVIVSRALPDVRDGLKPVQRRILFAMHEMGIKPGSQYRKSARIVGEVLGKYHPHGDSSVYEAMVRMAQTFSMRQPLVDGQGNFGSIDGDPPAAMRYTEARLDSISEEMLADIEEETVNVSSNFDDSLTEPVVLPARIPNLLVNGSSGIAVGMATNMPPHNIGEVCDAVIHTIDHPNTDVDTLMTMVKGPDLPTAAIIRGTDAIRSMYATGRGHIIMEAVCSIEEMPGRNNRQQIIITELPYQVNKAKLVAKIAELTNDKTIVGISDIRDESDRSGIRVVIELARTAQPQVILNNLHKRTALRSSFNAIMLALVDGQPQELSLKELITYFIQHRIEVIERRTEYRLKRAKLRDHIVQGLLVALDQIDAIIQCIRNSQDVETARNQLITEFTLSSEQAQAILDMQLRRLAALERQRLQDEHDQHIQTIAYLEGLLQDPGKILTEIKQETRQVKTKHNNPRRTAIIAEEVHEQSIENFIVREDIVVTLSQRGYIKRVPIDVYRTQKRGGKGVKGTTNREDDAQIQVQVVDTHSQILAFTNKGRVYPIKAHEIPGESGRTSRGTLIVNLLSLQPGEYVQTIIPQVSEDRDLPYLFATKRGRVNALHPGELNNLRASGLSAIKLADNDELVSVRTALPDSNVIMVSADGQALMCRVKSITPHKRNTGGVTGMRLRPGDHLVTMEVVNNPKDEFLLVVSQNGYGKASPLYIKSQQRENYSAKGRGGMGVKTFAVVTTGDRPSGPIVDAKIVSAAEMNGEEGYEVFIISSNGQLVRINLNDVKVVNQRQSKGVIIWRQRSAQDTIASISCFRPTNHQETLDQKTLDQETLDQETLGQETLDQETLDQETLGQETLGQETLDQETLDQETLDQETLDQDDEPEPDQPAPDTTPETDEEPDVPAVILEAEQIVRQTQSTDETPRRPRQRPSSDEPPDLTQPTLL